MDNCVMCGRELPTESGSMVCPSCTLSCLAKPTNTFDWPAEEIAFPYKPNVELSFGAADGNYDFIVNYRRAKPLNRFQIWMYKVCFGIRARNI